MAKSPAFQFYPKDWLSSQKISLMTPAEEGAYIRLLCYCWDDEDCSIPDDDVMLSRMSRLGEGWLSQGSASVIQCFIKHPNKPGFLTHERLLKEKEKQKNWSEKCKIYAKKSVEARALSRNTNDLKIKRKVGSTKAKPTLNSSSSSADIDKDIKSISLSNSAKQKKDFILPDWIDEDVWQGFLNYRHAKDRKVLSPMAQKFAITKLTKFRDDGEDPNEILREAILRNWSGIFSLKSQVGGSNGQRKESSTERFDRINSEAIRRDEEHERREREKNITPAGSHTQGFSGDEFDLLS